MKKNGFNMYIKEDGTLHVTEYTQDGTNMRYSSDMDKEGNLTNRHLVDQDDNSKLNLPDCKVEDDDLR